MKKNKRSLDLLKECGVQILFEVLHVKSLSPLVKNDGYDILHSILMYYGNECAMQLKGEWRESIVNSTVSDYVSRRAMGREGV